MSVTVNTQGGDYANRDMYKFTYSPSTLPVSKLRKLFEKFESEKQTDPTLNSIVQELQHLMTPREGEVVVGLENKLKSANKPQDSIDMAMEYKDQYSKKLYKQQFYESFQNINLILLAAARTQFMNYVYPIIKRKGSDEQVAFMLDEYVIKHLNALLDVDEEHVFSPGDEWGIIYFLTGNCFIKWV